MNCSDLESLARSGQLKQRSNDGEVLAHLRQCGACEVLYTTGTVGDVLVEAADTQVVLDLDAMRSELEVVLAAEERDPAARMRALPTPWRTAAVVGVVTLTLVLVWATWLRSNWQTYPEVRMWVTLLAFCGVLAWSLRELYRPLSQLERPSLRLAALIATVVLPVVCALIPHEHGVLAAPSDPLIAAGKCLALGLGLAVPSAMFVVLGLRTPVYEPSGSDLLTLSLGAGAMGVVGNLVLQLHCALTVSSHLLLGHAALSAVWLLVLWAWSRSVRRP